MLRTLPIVHSILFAIIQTLLTPEVVMCQETESVQIRIVIQAGTKGEVERGRRIRDFLLEHGLEAEITDPAGLLSDLQFPEEKRLGLIVLPECRSITAEAFQGIEMALKYGVPFLTIGGPAFEQVLYDTPVGKLTRDELLKKTSRVEPFLQDSDRDASLWARAADVPDIRTELRVFDAPEPAGGLAVEIRIRTDDRTGFCTFFSPERESGFSPDHTLTAFWARGDSNTEQFLLELREKDGSRWMAVVPLKTEWEYYVLPPEAFRYWPDNWSTGRGGPADRVRPENVAVFSAGLARSHGGFTSGEHVIAISNFGFAALEFSVPEVTPPDLDGLYPFYKFHELEIGKVRFQDTRFPDANADLGGNVMVLSAMDRPRGLGFVKTPSMRFVPIAGIRGEPGEKRAVPFWIHYRFRDPYPLGSWGSIGLKSEDFDPLFDRVSPILLTVVRELTRPFHLRCAGAVAASSFLDEPMEFRASVARRSWAEGTVEVRFTLRSPEGETLLNRILTPLFPEGENLTEVGLSVEPIRMPKEGFHTAVFEIFSGDDLLDRIEHPFTRIDCTPADPSEFVRVKDGVFLLGEEQWIPHGMNFWPQYQSGLDTADFAKNWLDPSQYDPLYLEEDLARMAALGVNAISFQCRSIEQVPTVNDVLYRMGRHGIRCNLFLEGGYAPTPEKWNPTRLLSLITLGRWAGNPNLYAYDLLWEPHMGAYRARARYNERWREWVIEQYGSVEAAIEDWGFEPERTAETLHGPKDEHFLESGDWDRMVRAYLRFAEDFISRRYNLLRQAVKTVDPNRLLGVRTGWGGTATRWALTGMQYDLAAGAKHLDFISPESWGYSSIDMWEAGIMTAYGRWVSGGKPVFWSEFGLSIFPDPPPGIVNEQEQVYEATYRMILESGARGSAGWWTVGGIRIAEWSDYGIINVDGTPRPSALALKKNAQAQKSERPVPEIEEWIEVDLDALRPGMFGVREKARDPYRAALDLGRFPGLRSPGTGTNSMNAPLVCVGGYPYNGRGPLRYLNAEWNLIEVLSPQGNWVRMHDGEPLRIEPGEPLLVRASAGNTGEAAWVRSPARGGVFLRIENRGQQIHRVPILSEAGFLEDTLWPGFQVPSDRLSSGELTFVLEALDRCVFGERIRLNLEVTE